MPTDWYRNTTWDASIERTFNEKLRRARNRGEYLKCQANALAATFPEVALELLDRWFALGEATLAADALEIRARALVALDRIEEAFAAYEAVLKREEEFPNVKTNVCLDLPLLVAVRRVKERYFRALELADQAEQDESLMTFPAARFQTHAARALILADSGSPAAARVDARLALEAAELRHSSYRYHPEIGLVTPRDAALVEELRTIVG